MKKDKPINGTEHTSQFSDAFFVRVAKVKFPGYDHYVLLRERDPVVGDRDNPRKAVGLVTGFEIAITVPIPLLWDAYQEKSFDKEAVRRFKRNGDVAAMADSENLVEHVLKPVVKRYNAEGAQLILHFDKEIKTAMFELNLQEAREGYCTGIYHMEQFFRGGDSI